jgi:exoribonuclease-2
VEKGTLIEFRLHGERRLAVSDRPEGKKDWIVIDQHGNSHKIRPQRVEYQVEGGPYQPSDIPPFLKQVQPHLDSSNLEVAWELLEEEQKSVTPQDLATLLFSEHNPALCYVSHILLSEDKIYFKKKGDSYEPRSSTQVGEIKHQIEVELQKKQEREQFLSRVSQVLAGNKIEWSESDRLRLEFLEKFVLQGENPPKQAQEILEDLGRKNTPEEAFRLLVDCGWWSKHENLFLRRSNYPLCFPSKVSEVAQICLVSPPQDPDVQRLDLTHLKVYTIDDESTTEIDDGLSIEYLDHGITRIWIHIADPTRLISPNDPLDLEARKRSTSLYLPTGMVSMFPPELATGPMSLVQGKICCALSFGLILDDLGAVEDYVIYPSWIKPTYRLTYQDVDEMLHLDIQDEPEIKKLAELAEKRQQWRISQGSITISLPEAIIKVKDNEEVVIELLDKSRSRNLVAEMMIVAGEIAARYGRENNLPLPFRSQPQPDLPPEEELILLPPGPVRSCALRGCMPRSELGLTPARHSSLGLDSYIQVTSPIRRYTDLLAHFQIKAHLRGEPLPFSREEMVEILYSVTSTSAEAVLVERQTNRYWSLEYLRRNADQIWQGLVLRWLRPDDNLGIILLEELGLELPHRFERSVKLGDRITVQVARSDPQRDEIRFKEVVNN